VALSSLQIADLRVIERLAFEPGGGINLIVGENGAGKTSVLEAIYLLGRGQTFRHRDAGPMIRSGADQTLVLAEVFDALRGRAIRMGLRRGNREFACRIDGADVNRRSELSVALPLQFIGSQPQLVLDLGPEVRRRFLDMAVFHVEHSYLGALTEYQRCLRQRNAAIRSGALDASVSAWDRPFAEAALEIDARRRSILDGLLHRIHDLLQNWDCGFSVTIKYRQGWRDDGQSLLEQLRLKLESDRRQGFTGPGPHRAELEISSGGGLAAKRLSRGQQKLLVFALNLALIDCVTEARGKAPILLIDDLAAELDQVNKKRLLTELDRRGLQVFITMIDESSLPLNTPGDYSMFHVKHGRLEGDVHV
jgi:DNA replication and repair protein RecF